jgi:hypothetical protein
VPENVWIVAKSPPEDGIGSRLFHFSEAVWLSMKFGCSVIVDWRGTPFLKDDALNYFSEFLVPLPEILGVPIAYPPGPGLQEYEQALPGGLQEVSVEDLRRLEAEQPRTPTYLLAMHSLGLADYPELRRGYRAFRSSFYRHIVPRPEVAEPLEAWYDAHLRGHFVVGVNVATGNGLFAPGAESEGYVDTSVFDDEEGFLRAIEVACEKATKRLSGARKRDYKIFVATDSAVVADLVHRLPRAVTRRAVFPPPGAGRYFCDYDELGYSDRAAAVDTVVDMLLLARCDALVKNNSRFSFYARVVNDYFGGNEWNFEKLYRKLVAANGARES